MKISAPQRTSSNADKIPGTINLRFCDNTGNGNDAAPRAKRGRIGK